jgi:hypothetical protein
MQKVKLYTNTVFIFVITWLLGISKPGWSIFGLHIYFDSCFIIKFLFTMKQGLCSRSRYINYNTYQQFWKSHTHNLIFLLPSPWTFCVHMYVLSVFLCKLFREQQRRINKNGHQAQTGVIWTAVRIGTNFWQLWNLNWGQKNASILGC